MSNGSEYSIARIAIALERIADLLDPAVRREKAEKRLRQERYDKYLDWCKEAERRVLPYAHLIIKRAIAAWGDPHPRLCHLLPDKIAWRLQGVSFTAAVNWFVDSLDGDLPDLGLVEVEAKALAAQFRWPDMIFKAGSKSQARYEAWRNGKSATPAEPERGKEADTSRK